MAAAMVGCVDHVSRLTSGALTPGPGVLQLRSGVLRGSQPPPQPPAAVGALSVRSAPVPASPPACCSSSSAVLRRARALSAASSSYSGGGFCAETFRAAAAASLARVAPTSTSSRTGHQLGANGGASVGPRIVCLQAVEELPANLQSIVKGFQAVPDPMARYQQLLYYATKLEPLPAELHLPQYKVKGCVSQVWVVPTLREDGTVHFRADSDSALTKGLAALLVGGLSGSRPEDIIRISPDFIELLGLKQKLTPSRNNGFLNMLVTMQKLTLELYMEAEGRKNAGASDGTDDDVGNVAREVMGSAANSNENGSGGRGGDQGERPGRENGGGTVEREVVGQQQSVAAAAASSSGRPVFESMKRKIEASLRPSLLEIEDQSSEHSGHAGVASSAGKETHFTVKVVSEEFEGKSSVKRHRLIYDLLDEEFASGLHALSLITKAPSEV
ncbi:hypothetical protein CBR_g26312 [Chara braunii]|uniref:Fe-S metabolism associated domain-containing protein n=1 Tax=Chara braunii TaxID=69332 RepID=A0A388L7H9_CHABU|nr:hypothetical protein CBR_g26312 [Chara braunii]|eukprot:GBG78281.1 hypothetical protein CBR_g26312 [Chara braunii]